MKFKSSLRVKFTLIFMVFCIAISSTIIAFFSYTFRESITEKYYQNAIGVAKLAANILDGDEMTEYATTLTTDDAYYRYYDRLNNIKLNTDVYYLYVMYPINREHGIYLFDAELTAEQKEAVGEGESLLGSEVIFGDDFPSAMEVLDTGEPSKHFDVTQTLQGSVYQKLASAYAPIFDSHDKVVAFVGVDVNITEIDQFTNEAIYKTIEMVLCIVLIGMMLLIFLTQHSIIKPVRILKHHAEDIAEGKFGNQIVIKGHDEISEISDVFNRMSKSIEGSMNDIKVINDAYYRYVPSKIFEILNKSSVTDVHLGNQINVDLTILVFNIVGFRDIIKKMKSADMFRFINNVLNNVLPVVIEKEGVVETFQDAGFSAFYTGQCEAALATAVSVCHSINLMNQNGKFQVEGNIDIGIGITYGPVMLGIVGHDRRMSTISISEHTKMAEYLQNLATKYYSRIVITASAARKIARFDNTYHSRFIGFFYYSANEHYEKLYDVFDGDEEEIMRSKLQTKELFEEGVNLFCARNFEGARLAFIKVLKQFRKDNAAREYLYLCNKYCELTDKDQIPIYIEKA